jgi:hypothetical protein
MKSVCIRGVEAVCENRRVPLLMHAFSTEEQSKQSTLVPSSGSFGVFTHCIVFRGIPVTRFTLFAKYSLTKCLPYLFLLHCNCCLPILCSGFHKSFPNSFLNFPAFLLIYLYFAVTSRCLVMIDAALLLNTVISPMRRIRRWIFFVLALVPFCFCCNESHMVIAPQAFFLIVEKGKSLHPELSTFLCCMTVSKHV